MILGDRPSGQCIAVPYGTTFKTRIVGQLGCSSAMFKEFPTVGPQGISTTIEKLIPGSSPSQYYKDLSWTPSNSQYGPNFICSSIGDSTCLYSKNYCFTLLAGIVAPVLVNNTCKPVNYNSNLVTSSQVLSWSVDFNTIVVRPSFSTFIRYYHNGTQVFAIDVSSSSSVTYSNQSTYTKLLWTTTYNLPNGEYYVAFDYGIGLGTQFCLPQTDAVTDATFCQFSVNITTYTTMELTTTTEVRCLK